MNEVRQLFLLRHADAVPGGPSLEDFDRPLSPKGHRQARFVAAKLKGTPLDYVLCSAATRTRETVNPILQTRCAAMPTVVYDKTLYSADARMLLATLSTLPAALKNVLLVGHNPAIEDLLQTLAPTGGQLPGGFPKGACVHLATNASWDALSRQAPRVVGYYRGESEQAAVSTC
jgi:phosphohistidine phosphatase